jgi:hypothetical protein
MVFPPIDVVAHGGKGSETDRFFYWSTFLLFPRLDSLLGSFATLLEAE